MKSIAIIKTEHRNLASIIFTLDQLVKEIELNGKTVPFSVFHGLVYYLDSFLDRYHHPKENQYLFPTLQKKYPAANTIIEQFGKQHGQGEKLLLRIIKSLSAYEFLGVNGFLEFRDAVHEYIELERVHIQLEETEILPLAQHHLTDDDWEPIERAFKSNVDPLFGSGPSEEFLNLFHSLSRLVPAPYGLGPEME